MIERTDSWHGRSAISRRAHVLERTGLALTGGSCGLFVAAYVVRADIGLGSAAAVLAMLLYGAAGFYVGIDLPLRRPDHQLSLPPARKPGSSADSVELFSAAGTFLTAVPTAASVSGIVLDETARAGTARLIILGWAIGVTMQIAAGIVARMR